MFKRLGAIFIATSLYVTILVSFIRSLSIDFEQYEMFYLSWTMTIAIVIACIVLPIYTFILLPFVEVITRYARNRSEEWLLYNLFAFVLTLFGVLYVYVKERQLTDFFTIIVWDFVIFIGIALYVVALKLLGGAQWKNSH